MASTGAGVAAICLVVSVYRGFAMKGIEQISYATK